MSKYFFFLLVDQVSMIKLMDLPVQIYDDSIKKITTSWRSLTVHSGTVFILVMLACLSDPTSVFSSTTGQPIVQLVYLATRSRAATVVISVMLAICFINGTMGSMTSGSRLLYSMARDKGMIFPSFFGRIHPRLDVPIESIVFVQIFNVIFGLLYLGPTVAFNAYLASCTILLNLSYAIPITVLLIRGRSILTQHQVRYCSCQINFTPTNVLQHQTEETPFKLGKWGYTCNIVSVVFVFVTNVFFCFPAAVPVNTNTMNYGSGVIGEFVILLGAYYMFYGHRFEGPKFDVIMEIAEQEREVRCHSTDDHGNQVIHGLEHSGRRTSFVERQGYTKRQGVEMREKVDGPS